MSNVLVSLMLAGGMALIVGGVLLRTRDRDQALADILDLPFGERDVPSEAIEQRAALVDSTFGFANRVVEQFDAKGALAQALERARLPVRPGEFVVVVVSVTSGTALLLWVVTTRWWFALAAAVVSPVAAAGFLRFKVAARRKAFQAQLPDALSLIAGSLSAGHTFLRAVQMMTEEAEEPLKTEFSRVVYETRLGDPLVDALERLAVRLVVRDLEWVVQAIRVQQTVGGKLADLLHTLSDFMRSREEVRREIGVLTSEGRMSAWVLGAMPVFLLLALSSISPGYMKPMFRGWGYWWLGGMAASVAVGIGVILNMVKIEV